MRTVFIIDSNYPKDHYLDRADGAIAQQVLKALGIKADLRLALDRTYFVKAISRALKHRCDVLHISCHGDNDGIGLCSDNPSCNTPVGLSWPEITALFQEHTKPPTALVMSACCGAASGLATSFAGLSKRPDIIIGSTDERYPADYVAAWSLLYRRFKNSGINRDSAQDALKDICAVVHKNFRYHRWDQAKGHYRIFPGSDKKFRVTATRTSQARVCSEHAVNKNGLHLSLSKRRTNLSPLESNLQEIGS